MSKRKEVASALESLMDQGFTNKDFLYSTVVKKLNVPRPTVRQVARELRIKYEKRLKVLRLEVQPPFSLE